MPLVPCLWCDDQKVSEFQHNDTGYDNVKDDGGDDESGGGDANSGGGGGDHNDVDKKEKECTKCG